MRKPGSHTQEQREQARQLGKLNRRHGLSGTKVHNTWCAMWERVRGKNIEYYSANGITVCDRWKVFENFLADMGQPPSEEHTLDRIDGTKGYSPENCRWATVKEQARNRRTSRRLVLNGESKTIAEWSEITGIQQATINMRLRRGANHEAALRPIL